MTEKGEVADMRKKRDNRNWKAWLYLLPAILFLGVFMVYPLVDVFVYSFEEGYNSASQTYFGTGGYNYSYVLHDPYFLQAVKNTFLLVVITVPLSTGIALLVSVGLHSITPLRKFLQTVYFLQEDRIFRRFCKCTHQMVRRRKCGFYCRTLLGENVCAVFLHDLGGDAL